MRKQREHDLLRFNYVSRAQRSTKRSEVVRCRPGIRIAAMGPGSAAHRFALRRIRDTQFAD
jgi:hypothetical protein